MVDETTPSLFKKLTAEFLGTAFLLMAVVGSGIMAEELAGGNSGLALLANALATGAALLALIFTFGGLSGAHFNPGVSLAVAIRAQMKWSEFVWYVLAQVSGAIVGVIAAHVMFEEPWITVSGHARSGYAQGFSEFVATFGLLAVIWGVAKLHAPVTPICVSAYIVAAYWFTASTSFANPAVTLARSLTDTFSGIRPQDVPGFVLAQIAGAACATFLFGWLSPAKG